MALTLSEMSARVLALVNKDSGYSGFYTSEKVTAAINDCLDYITSFMMQSGEGWLLTIGYLDTVAGVNTVALPTDCSIIHAVRYLVSDVYRPLTYDDQAESVQLTSTTQQQFPTTFRLVGTDIYFNPAPSQAGTSFVQIEYSKYPSELALDADTTNTQFDRALLNYVKWRAASQLVSQAGKEMKEWERYENEWQQRMLEITSKRLRVIQYIKDFVP